MSQVAPVQVLRLRRWAESSPRAGWLPFKPVERRQEGRETAGVLNWERHLEASCKHAQVGPIASTLILMLCH